MSALAHKRTGKRVGASFAFARKIAVARIRPLRARGMPGIFRTTVQSPAYPLRRTCHASELRATPSKISWIPSNTPSSQTAVVVRLAKR